MNKRSIFCLAYLLGALAATGAHAQTECEAMVGETAGNGVVLEAFRVADSLTIASRFGGAATIPESACLVRGQIKPTADSDIRFEVWLPEQEKWNGYMQTVGNGGNAGTIFYPGMLNGFLGGYATVSTDTGHIGAMNDSSYAVGHPEKVIDFGWRSLKEVPLAANAVIEAYYGRAPDLAVFNGCSTGGRQALQIAQRFPELYQGIVAGAPAAYWPELNAMHADYGKFLLSDAGYWLSEAKLGAAQAAVHEACGSVDGMIDDPERCTFDYAELACDGKDRGNCLTEKEIASLTRRYADLKDSNGKLLYPSYAQGAETDLSAGWMGRSAEERFYGSLTWQFPEGFYRDYVHGDPGWSVRDFDLERDLFAAQNGVIGVAVHAHNPDLSEFRKAGGKLVMWHGWHDMGIPASNTVRYYRDVLDEMGADAVDDFVRVFMGPGVGHCAGGVGPDAIGGAFNPPAPRRDKDHDVVEAVVHWLKHAEAPVSIVASKWDASGKVIAQRPWCAYPDIAVWDGEGDRASVGSYVCRARP